MATEEKQLNESTSNFFADIQEKFLTTEPMWARLGYLANSVNKAIHDGVSETDIDFEKINRFLATNVSKYDFNDFDKITNVKQLNDAMIDNRTALIIGIWQKHKCEDCGQMFYMTYNEVDFFKNKGFEIPKRCPSCRAYRKVKFSKS